MNHLSIAVIRKKSTTKKDQFDYLAINLGTSFKFFEAINIAIGGTFEFSEFKNQIIEYFELPKTVDTGENSTTVDFEVPPTLFKSNKRNPEATAYLYQLSTPQIEAVNGNIQTNEGKWANIKWISEDDLRSHTWKSSQSFLFERESSFNPPRFSNDFRASLKKIVSAKNNGKLVIFAGAGVSVDSHVPSWGTLITELKNDLSTTETNFLKVAEVYYQSRGEKEYHERVQEILNYGRTNYNAVHKKIVDLNPVHIITTNYDTHFEQLFENKGLPYSIVRADKDLPYSKSSSLYVKMHGDFGLRNIVLRQTDYDNYTDNFSLIQSLVRETFASKLVLFIGFSFSDTNLQHILNSVKKILDQDIQQPYLYNNLSTDSEIEEARIGLQKQGVRLLQYEAALDDYFDQVKSSEDEEAIEKISTKGQSVYKFLKVIEEFDLVSDSLENLEIKNQFIQSLKRFNELGSIPIDILRSMVPFKLKRHPKSQKELNAEFNYYEPFHLEVLNEDLLSFLESRKNEKGEVDFITYRDNDISDDEQNLNKSLKLVFSSGVHYIRRKSDTKSTHLRLNPINKENQECNCPRCLNDRHDLKKLIYSLNSASARSICKRGFHDEGLQEARGYFKTGQIFKSFYALEAVRIEALKSERYITYFVATYNQTLLRPMIRNFYETNYKEDEADRIIEKVDSLDLYKILNDLPVPTDIKQCLQLILENNIHTRMLSKMEDDFEEIKKTFTNYKKPLYYSSGPNYWYRFQSFYHLTWNFYHQNLLFTDETYAFTKMTNFYIEGMLASYATSSKYSQRLIEFPSFFAGVMIQYGYPTDITKLFQEYEIAELKIGEGLTEIIKEFEQFLESGLERNMIFTDRVFKDVSYHALIENSNFFKNKVTRTFNNFLILLSHVPLAEGHVNSLIKKILDFLKVNEVFDAANSLTYFSRFVKHYINKIDNDGIQKVALFILSDNIWPGGLINSFCNALITDRKVQKVFDEDTYLKLSRRIEKRGQWTASISDVLPFYSLLKTEQQEKFTILFENQIKADGSRKWDLLNLAYRWLVWDPNVKPQLFEEFSSHIVNQVKDFPEYEIAEDGYPIGKNFQPWNDLYIFVQMVYSHQLLNHPIVERVHKSIKNDMFKWILKPDSYDYSKFDNKWLTVFPGVVFTNKLKIISSLKVAVNKGLKGNYDSRVSEIFYTKLNND